MWWDGDSAFTVVSYLYCSELLRLTTSNRYVLALRLEQGLVALHRENLALKDLWEDEELSEFLGEVDAFLNSVAKCLQMSPPLQDELVFFTNMVVASFKPGQSHSMEHAASRWNSRKPLICNVSNSYGAWVLYTRRHSTCANDSWARHHVWLLKPTTNIRIKGVADVLEMYDRKGPSPSPPAPSPIPPTANPQRGGRRWS